MDNATSHTAVEPRRRGLTIVAIISAAVLASVTEANGDHVDVADALDETLCTD